MSKWHVFYESGEIITNNHVILSHTLKKKIQDYGPI